LLNNLLNLRATGYKPEQEKEAKTGNELSAVSGIAALF